MKREEIFKYGKKEFEDISKDIYGKNYLSYLDFLRIRNFKLQNFTTEKEERINKITSEAFRLAKENKIKEAIDKLRELHGVAIPIASAILAMKYPNKYAIIDRRVLTSLKKEEWIKKDKYTKDSKIYEDYMILMRKTKPSNMSLRDYERSLFEKVKKIN